MNAQPRVFTPSTNNTEPKALFIGLYGPSGSGKTYSALSAGDGHSGSARRRDRRRRHRGRPRKALHAAVRVHALLVRGAVPIGRLSRRAPPARRQRRAHDHRRLDEPRAFRPGGVTETHDKIVAEKGQNYTFTAWRIAKAGRKQLITAMTTEFKGCCFIFCFRAKDTTDFEVEAAAQARLDADLGR
jgi:hypothetical protein